MRLTRITKIRGHRVFREFAWPNDLHAFAQFNLIYGWNGSGKTTLSSLLSYLEKRTPLSEGEIELEFDASLKVRGAALGSTPVPHVRVFNRDFVNATLQSIGSGIAPIYFLGEGSVEKQARVEKLRQDLTSANLELTSATTERDAAETKLDDFCKYKAKLIKELLTTANSPAYNNYDKRRFKQAIVALDTESASAALLTTDEKARLRSQKDAQPKAAVEEIAVPSVDVDALTNETETLVGRSVTAQTLNELTDNASLASWVQHGLTLHSAEYASTNCRFCLQPLTEARRSALEAHFNDAFAAFQQALNATLARLATAKQRLGTLRVPEPTQFYEHLAAEAEAACVSQRAAAESDVKRLQDLISRVETKRENPFALAPATSAPKSVSSSISEAITSVNATIRKHNQTTEHFKRSVDEASARLERCYLAEAHAEHAQLVDALKTANDNLERVKATPAKITKTIGDLERDIVEHRRPAEQLTEELRAYLGRDELRFEVKEAGYALTRSGQPVVHLSEGERTAIAFLYFPNLSRTRTSTCRRALLLSTILFPASTQTRCSRRLVT